MTTRAPRAATPPVPRRPFGRTGVEVAVLGQGTWELEQAPRAQAVAALRRGVELGLTHIDTAEMYGDGRAEELVGEALAGPAPARAGAARAGTGRTSGAGALRDRVFLASKVLPQNASRRGTVAACEASLKRLRTDHLDLYLLHWPGDHPLEETIAAFEELVAAGKTRAWGVSNFDEALLARAVALAGAGRIACNQVLYHLGERAIEHKVIPYCERQGIAVVAYSPFGSGPFVKRGSRGFKVLEQVAERAGGTVRQVALAFLTLRASVFAIPKAAKAEHLEDNAGAAALRLGAEDVELIDAAFPRGPWKPGVPTI